MKSKKQLSVSLLITSSSLGLEDMSSRLGRSYSSGSHEKDNHGSKSISAERTIWRLNSTESDSATLEEHIANIASQLPPDMLLASNLPSDALVYIDIAIFFDTPMCSLNIPAKSLNIVKAYNAAMEITCYPSDFEFETV